MGITDFLQRSAASKQWQHIGMHPHHGIVVPLFALRSRASCGIGEFPDLLPLLAWCKEIGLDIIQLLPLNDTAHSPSPYGAISACALNPQHLGLAALPYVFENEELQALLQEMQKLNFLPRIDYEQLLPLREHFLEKYFHYYAAKFISSAEYLEFKATNPWLEDYALFKAIKIARHWESWEKWPSPMKSPSVHELYQLKQQFAQDIQLHSLIQYFCFRQLKAVKSEAQEQAVFIKGDLPILVDKESCDVWLNVHLFDLYHGAGAPPDAYSSTGQNWGFPLYNWQEMEKHNYKWFRQRLQVAANFYHIYRIDHVVGLYRIWAIPPLKLAKEGYFVPENPTLWVACGEKIMRMLLEITAMLPIGEDLGTVPPAVKANLKELGIPGTCVMRWEREWHQEKQPYIDIKSYHPLSITTVSTHDSETLHQWWEAHPEEARALAASQGWPYSVPLSAQGRTDILKESHHTSSLFHINLLQEYLAYFPELVWEDPQMERINTPGTISKDNWSYRFRPTLEEIMAHRPLAVYIAGLIE